MNLVYTKRPSLEELMINLPVVKEDKILNKRPAKVKDKDKDKGGSFDSSKVLMQFIYDGCNSHRCLYSNKMVGEKVGPTKFEVEGLQKRQEGEYMCVSKVPGEKNMFGGKCFVVNILSQNITITCVGRKQ